MGSAPVAGLMFFTLSIVFLAVLTAYVWHIRKESNRHPMKNVRERNYAEMQAGKAPEPKR